MYKLLSLVLLSFTTTLALADGPDTPATTVFTRGFLRATNQVSAQTYLGAALASLAADNGAALTNLNPLALSGVAYTTNLVFTTNSTTSSGSTSGASSTYTAWGWPLGVVSGGFDAVQVAVDAWSSGSVPTALTCNVRVQGLYLTNWFTSIPINSVTNPANWQLLATATQPVTLSVGVMTPVTFTLSQWVTNANILWLEVLANGKLAMQGVSSSWPLTNPLLYAVPTYQTTASLITSNWDNSSSYPPGNNGAMWSALLDSTTNLIIAAGATNAWGLSYNTNVSGLLTNNVQGAIDQMALNQNSAARVILPKQWVAVTGDTLQLFSKGICESPNYLTLAVEYASDTGITNPAGRYGRYWEFTPASGQEGSHPFSAYIFNMDGTTNHSSTNILKVVAASHQPVSTKYILCVGDSMTASGVWPNEFYRRLTQSGGTPTGKGFGNVQLIGTTPLTNFTSQFYTAIPGWHWYDYTNVQSISYYLTTAATLYSQDVGNVYSDSAGATWVLQSTNGLPKVGYYSGSTSLPAASGTLTYINNVCGNLPSHTSNVSFTGTNGISRTPFSTNSGAFSFTAFCGTNGWPQIDEAIIMLGWNDINAAGLTDAAWPWQHTVESNNMAAFVKQLTNDYPNCLVRLVSLPVPGNAGNLTASYGGSGVNNTLGAWYKCVRTMNGYNMMVDSYANSIVNGVHINTAGQLDSDYNEVYSWYAVNTRNSSTNELRGANGIHPAAAGYLQIADAVYRQFISDFCYP